MTSQSDMKQNDIPHIRVGPQKEIKKVFVIDNGAIERRSKPLDAFLELLQPNNLTTFDATKLEMETTFSCMVAQENQRLAILHATANGEFQPKALNGSSDIDCLLKHAAGSISARMRLGEEYEKCNELAFRKTVLESMEEEGLFDSDSFVVTTNWDQTLWNEEKLRNLAYLHGRCNDPLTMILPTQTWTTNLREQNHTEFRTMEPLAKL